jgi:hypothetical protein
MAFPRLKLSPKAKFRIKHHAIETGVIAGGSLAGAAIYDGGKDAVGRIRKKNTESPREFDLKSKAAWVGTIAAGDIIGEGTLDAIKSRRKKKSGIQRGIEKKTAVPGSGPTSLARTGSTTFFIKKPDPYIIRRATLRGKKPPGVPKVKRFEDVRKTTNLNPKGKKSETFKNVAVGTGALLGGAGTAYAGHKIGKAADIAEKLQKHVGGLATSAHDKVAAHIDYVGHHAGEAAEESTRAARAARKTAASYHPRAIGKMLAGKLKKVPVFKRFMSALPATTNFNAMKERHPRGDEDKDSFLKRNGVRIAGTAAGIAGTALFFKHFKPVRSGPDVTKGVGITKAAAAKKPSVVVPGAKKEKRPYKKHAPEPITNIRKVRSRRVPLSSVAVKKPKKTKMSALRVITHFDKQGRDTSGQMAPKAELVPSYRKAKKIVTVGKRGGDVAQDLHDVIHGKPKDPKKKRFWEKAWFQTGALAGAGALGIRAHRKHAEKHGYEPYFDAKLSPTEFSKLTDAIAHHKLVMSAKRRLYRIASHPMLKKFPQVRASIVSRERQRYQALAGAQPHMSLLQRHVHPTELAFLIHDEDFPILPLKQPKLPKGMKQRVPNAETKAEVIKRMQKNTELSSGGGLGKVAAETIIDGATIGADLGPKKKKPTKAQIAAKNADPDLVPTNNWTADIQAPVKKMQRRARTTFFAELPVGIPPVRPTPRSTNVIAAKQDFRPLSTKNHGLDKFNRQAIGTRLSAKSKRTEFYGTSDGVTKSWDTRGRRDATPKAAHWWTHSPTKNSVRVVRSTSESGPRTRRGKKFHEKTSTHKAAIAIATGAAVGLGGLAAYKHGQVKGLRKELVGVQQKYNQAVTHPSKTATKPTKKVFYRKGRSTQAKKTPGG